jgi:hypothetical protein
MNLFALEPCDATRRQNIYREIECERSRMEQVQGPQVDSAAGEVGPTRSLRDDSGRRE